MQTLVISQHHKQALLKKQALPFNELLRAKREKKRISPKQMAKYARVSEKEYLRWEKGEALPNPVQLKLMWGTDQFLQDVLAASETPKVERPTDDVDVSANAVQLATESQELDKQPPIASPVPSVVPETQDPSPTPTPNTTLVSFAAALRGCRDAANYSQNDVGARLGVSAGMLSHWENGRATPSRVQYDTLCAIFPELGSLHEPIVFTSVTRSNSVVACRMTRAEFATAFRSARSAANLSIEEIAKHLNVHISSVYSWTNGANLPNNQAYAKLLELFPDLTSCSDQARPPHPTPTTETMEIVSTTPDVLSTLDTTIAALSPVGLDLAPKYTRTTEGWKVEVSDREPRSDKQLFSVEATGVGMLGATKAVLAELAPALDTQKAVLQAHIAELQKRLTAIQEARAMVSALE